MATGAVSGDADLSRVSTILRCMLHDVRDTAEYIFNEVRHGVVRGIAIALRRPAVIHADRDKFTVFGQLACEASHDVFVIGVPSATVNDDDHRQVERALRREDIVFEWFCAGFRVDDVVLHIDVTDR